MEIYILILLAVLVVLMIAAIALILSNKPKKDNSIALLDQKADINAKRTQEGLRTVSEQMHRLTEKNYEQMLKINESLNENAERQTKRINDSIGLMQESNEKNEEQTV